MGGPHVALRSGKSLAGRALRLFAARQLPDPRDLLVHCAQEMSQLAAFQPALYDRLGNAWSDELLGRSGHRERA